MQLQWECAYLTPGKALTRENFSSVILNFPGDILRLVTTKQQYVHVRGRLNEIYAN